MSSTTSAEQFSAERAMLGGRDRDELHEIASAMGVRGATRLRKAELIEAILAKAGGAEEPIPEPTGEKKKGRATRRKAEDPDGDGDGDQASSESGQTPEAESPAAESPEPDKPETATSQPASVSSGSDSDSDDDGTADDDRRGSRAEATGERGATTTEQPRREPQETSPRG
ncbi:MAG: Rho termination factor N-terminal domain-containing protein, partial [Acidimicrobiia bacterium]